MSKSTHPDIPEKSWTNPFQEGTWLYSEFEDVVSEERDIIIILDDYFGRRGTGKTIASMQLANGMDQTEEGLTWDKVSMRPEEIRNAYADLPKRSGLVLDEAEVGASNREAMTNTNKALREIMSMGRVEQKYVIVNTPVIDFIDRDLQKLSTVWITMLRRGFALVHHLRREPYSKSLLTPQKQTIEFKDIPRDTELREVYNKLTREKRKRIRGESGGGFVEREKHREKLRKAVEDAKDEKRDELIYRMYTSTDLSQSAVADIAGVSQKTVSNIYQRRSDE